MINKVTFTGPDGSTRFRDLTNTFQRFPFIEWGILVSRSQKGMARFPSITWMRSFDKHLENNNVENLPLSIHLCGAMVREFISGDDKFIKDIPLWKRAQRVQINFHAIKHKHTSKLFMMLAKHSNKEFIFQHDGVNEEIVYEAIKQGAKNVSILFDKSGGAGILPDHWPFPIDLVRCGYAGGLGPDNIEEQVQEINKLTNDQPSWVDMETRVRSEDDKIFDTLKVRAVCKIMEPIIVDYEY